MNKRILMICYYYPPLKDVGATRSVAFSKYLKKYGWSPHIISVKNPDRAYCSIGGDAAPNGIPVEYSYSIVNLYQFSGRANGLLARIAKIFGVKVKTNYFRHLFCIPDHFWGWIPLTIRKCLKVIERFDADIIYASCSPFSSAVIGCIVKAITKKPLVLDFRDPFSIEYLARNFGIPGFRLKLNKFIETQMLKYADLFIVTTEEIMEAYIKQYPFVKEKIFTIHNGFDSEYLTDTKHDYFKKFTIVYTGEFYSYAMDSRGFFEALGILKRKRLIDSSNFQFLFFGEDQEVPKMAGDNGVSDLVSMSPRIPYREVLDIISKSHLSLLRIIKPMISTKLFEGIPMNTLFLATIPAGEAARIIDEYSPSSYIITERSPEMIARAILDAKQKFEIGLIRENKVEEFLQKYSREKLTLKLIDLMERKLNYGKDTANN